MLYHFFFNSFLHILCACLSPISLFRASMTGGSVMSMIECEIRRLWKKYLVSESTIEMEYDANEWTMV